jgi:hypothetical protein
MSNLKALFLVAFVILARSSKSPDFILTSKDKDTPIEFSFEASPYLMKFDITPNSEITLSSRDTNFFEYNPSDDTFKMPLDVKLGNDLVMKGEPTDLSYMDTLQWKLYYLDDFQETPEGWSDTMTSTCGNNPNRFLGIDLWKMAN